MDYKEKYEKAIQAAILAKQNTESAVTIGILENIFPELVESEDERIREQIIDYFVAKKINEPQPVLDSWIAWLEKQGDLTSADKFEPKFHEGDLVVSDFTGSVYQIKDCIENLSNHKYGYDLTNGGYIASGEERHYHLWTIQDAKDGDILSNHNSIVIFRGIGSEKWNNVIDYHIGLFTDSQHLVIQKNLSHWGRINKITLHPATKEQRDILFAKMKQAGYEWDSEKKELKKIEPKANCTYCKEHCKGYQETGKCFVDGECKGKKEERKPDRVDNIHNYLYGEPNADTNQLNELETCLKHIMEEAIECGDTHNLKADAEMLWKAVFKPAWSEKDKIALGDALWCCKQAASIAKDENDMGNVWYAENWLKSLKPRYTWKPSEEQIKVCKEVYADILSAKGFDLGTVNSELNRLEEDLKKLREE